MTHPLKLSVLFLGMVFVPILSHAISGQDETNKQIVIALAAGDTEALSGFLNEMVDLGISGNEDTYSKTQAIQILKDFFTKNPVKTVKITRQGSSTDGSIFAIGEMKAGTGIFRVYYLLKKINGKFLIKQLQIQKSN